MRLQNDRELETTRDKLKLLEERYDESRRDTTGDAHIRELSQRSLKRLINQLQEEIVRYEVHKGEHAADKN
jgi:hypothetical protein